MHTGSLSHLYMCELTEAVLDTLARLMTSGSARGPVLPQPLPTLSCKGATNGMDTTACVFSKRGTSFLWVGAPQ